MDVVERNKGRVQVGLNQVCYNLVVTSGLIFQAISAAFLKPEGVAQVALDQNLLEIFHL